MIQIACKPRGFSLIELVIVLAIAGVIGAIAVPRLSSVAQDAPIIAYKADLAAIQDAVERYTAEHIGKAPDSLKFAQQLTQFTDLNGNISAVRTATHLYGPYLRKMPEVYVGPKVEAADLTDKDLSDGSATEEVVIRSPVTSKLTVWVYNPVTSQVRLRVSAVANVQVAPIANELQAN